jgi:hypothetical protein
MVSPDAQDAGHVRVSWQSDFPKSKKVTLPRRPLHRCYGWRLYSVTYTVCGQVKPEVTLPIQLDVGTNCQVLIDDPLYHGWCHSRLRRAEYLKFVEAVKDVFGKTTLID